jgi:hypothetical protein
MFDNKVNNGKNISVYKNMPLFYTLFLDHPDNISKFFDAILILLEKTENPNMPLHKNANIITLLSCAIFHISKLYILLKMNYDSYYDTFVFYNIPFTNFIKKLFYSNVINYRSINCMQKIKGFATPYTYMLLTFGVSSENDMEYTPLWVFTKAINDHNIPFTINVLEEIYYPLLKEDYKDIYNYSLALLPDISSLSSNMVYKSIIDINNYYVKTVNDFHEERVSVFDYSDLDYDKCLIFDINIYDFFYNNHKNNKIYNKSFEMFLFLNNNIMNYEILEENQVSSKLYIVIDGVIQNTKRWQILLIELWKYIERCSSLYNDIFNIFVELFVDDVVVEKINEKLFRRLDVRESLLFPMIRNISYKYNNENIIYFKNIIKAILNNDYNELYASYYFQNIFQNDSVVLYILNKDKNDILFYILYSFFDSNEIQIKDIEVSSPIVKSLIHSYTPTPMSLNITNNKIMKATLKTIIKNLIKNNISYLNNELYAKKESFYDFYKMYIAKLKSFQNSLKQECKIDLDKFHLDKLIVSSPISNAKRSIDKSYKSLELHKKNIFINFKNKKLAKKLTQIYSKSVQSIICLQNNDDRIMKIQKYLIDKYKYNIDYINTDYLHDPSIYKIYNVQRGKEFKILYKFWYNELQQDDLNVPLMIFYKDEIGQDLGAITRNFLTNVAIQLGNNNIFILGNDSPRYILNPKISTDMGYFIGQLLALFILYNIKIPFNLSIYYLGHMMFRTLSYEEKFLYFMLDLYPKQQKRYLEGCALTPNQDYDPCDISDNIENQYNDNSDIFDNFISGFFFPKKEFTNKFIYINDKIRVYDLDKILSKNHYSKTSAKKYIFDNITIRYKRESEEYIDIDKDDISCTIYKWLKGLFIEDDTFDIYYNTFDNNILEGIPNYLKEKQKYQTKEKFCEAILKFWSGTYGILSAENYIITIDPNIENKIESHSCFNELVLPKYNQSNNNSNNFNNKQEIYNFFMKLFILNEHDQFHVL